MISKFAVSRLVTPIWLCVVMGVGLPILAPMSAQAVVTKKTPSSNYEAALTALKNDQTQTAIILLKNEIQANPNNVAARMLLGRTYIDMREGELAERELRAARRSGADPDLVMTLLGEAYLIKNTPQRVLDEVLPGFRSNELEAKVQILRGKAYLRLSKFSNADEAFNKAAELNPKSVDPYIGLAGIQVEQLRYRDALAILERTRKIDPVSRDVMITRGDVKRMSGDLSGALADYNAVADIEPKNINVRLTRAAVLIDMGKFDAALRDINATLAILPYHPQAKYLLAAVLGAKGDVAGAKKALAEAATILASISPESLTAERDRVMLAGAVAFQRGNAEEARKFLTLYVSMAPNDPSGRRLLAATQIHLGSFSDAVDHLKIIVQGLPDHVPSLNLLAQAYLGLNDMDRAAETLKRSISLAPQIASTHAMLGRVYQSQGKLDDAIGEYNTALRLQPGLRAAQGGLISANLQAGRGDAAGKAAEALLKATPNDPAIHNLAGLAAKKNGNYNLAKSYFLNAIKKDSAYVAAYLNLAELHLQLGENALAQARFQEVLKKQPKNVSAFVGMGRMAEAQKNIKAAQGWYERAKLAEPANPDPWARLINLQAQAKNYDTAIALGKDYASKYPENYEVKKALGLALVKGDKLVEAEQVYQYLVDVAPDRASALYELAVVRQMSGNMPGARQALLNAIAWNGKYAPAFIALMQLEAKAGDLKNIANLGKQLREVSPDLADAALGQSYLISSRYDLAEAAFRSGLNRTPGNWNLAAGLYKSLLKGGKAPEALAVMEGWKKSHPKDQRTDLLLASGYLQAGKAATAIPIYERLIAAQPNNPALLNDLAWAYHLIKDPRAAKVAEQAYRLAPQSAGIIDTLGWIWVRNGQAGKALPLLRQAQARDAQNPAISYHLASALEALGRHEEARTEVAKALKMSANFDGADQARLMMKRLSAK